MQIRIILKTPGWYESDDILDQRTPIKDQRFSIHPSDEGATTITQTINLVDKLPIKNSTYQLGPRETLTIPMFCRAAPNLAKTQYALKSAEDKIIIPVAQVDDSEASTGTVCYFVLVCGLEPGWDFVVSDLYSGSTSAIFTNYCLVVMSAYLAGLPPLDVGTLLHISTNNPKFGDDFIGEDLRGKVNVNQKPIHIVSNIVEQMFQDLASAHHAKAEAPQSGERQLVKFRPFINHIGPSETIVR